MKITKNSTAYLVNMAKQIWFQSDNIKSLIGSSDELKTYLFHIHTWPNGQRLR